MGIILDEKSSFQRMAGGLKEAADGARMMALHQPDKNFMWLKMAEVYEVAVQSLHRLSAESAKRTADRELKQ